MSEFNFKSQICTSKVQSERLLALGLKKETADMTWFRRSKNADWEISTYPYIDWVKEILPLELGYTHEDIIPAWSLGRLLELIKHSDICNYNDFGCIKLYIDLDDFEICITMISYMVKEGYFNKEYLV